MENVKHVNISDVAFNTIPELSERLELGDDYEQNRDNLQSLYHDCDHVKTSGEEGRGREMFIDVSVGGIKYIIWFYEPSEQAIKLVEWFLNGAKGDLIDGEKLSNNWGDWNKVEKGVAYRGGSGYSYALYAKELLPENR